MCQLARHALIFCCCCLASLGCSTNNNSGTENAEQKPPQFADGLAAGDIFKKMRAAYREAQSYQDQAVLYLSYRMDGRVIQEEQAWRQIWQKDGRREALWFNAEIRGDGQRIGCFVYDIESGNLDGQWLLNRDEGEGLRRIMTDPIARYFAAGRSELPLGANPGSVQDFLIPPPAIWLGSNDDWMDLHDFQKLSRLADGKVDGRACYHIQFGESAEGYDLWIDQETLALRQMTLPKTLLDSLVTSSEEVGEIQFFARMHGAEFNAALPADRFVVTRPKNSRPVQQFVPIPEPFPCESLGQVADLQLLEQSGNRAPVERFRGQTTALFWFSGLSGPGTISRLGEIRETLRKLNPQTKVQIIGVYADDQVDQDAESSPMVNRSLASVAEGLGVPFVWLFDPKLVSANNIRLVNTPAVVIVSPAGVLEYARGLGDQNWSGEVATAAERIHAGESLSQEMTADYQQFVERYHRRLELVNAERLLKGDSAPEKRGTLPRFELSELWRVEDLRKAGNLALVPGVPEPSLVVLDGARTVVEIDAQGKIIGRYELDLPAGETVTRIRVAEWEGGPVFAAFTPYGRAVYLFDRQWNSVRQLKGSGNEQVLDMVCRKGKRGNEIVVSYRGRGIVSYGLEGGETQLSDSGDFESIAVSVGGIDAVWRSGLVGFAETESGWETNPIAISMNVVKVASSPNDGRRFLLAVDHRGEWNLGAGGANGEDWDWTVVGPQIFENDVESMALVAPAGAGSVVVVDSRGNLLIKNARTGQAASLEMVRTCSGIAGWQSGDSFVLVTSDGSGLRAWRVEPPRN